MKDKGILYALGAYATWGLFPIYWKWLHTVAAPQLLAHRIGWSFLLLALFMTLGRQWKNLRQALTGRTLRIYLAAALLIGVNWLTYVWAVNAGFIVETSLGYFINPLLSVLLGMIFLREKLRPLQWIPIGLAAAGVIYLTLNYGRLPWIALTLAFSFGFYGLVKKTAPLSSLFGLTLETGILFLPAVGFLVWQEVAGQAAFLHSGALTNFLLVGAGLVTTIPLLMFASAAKQIPLATIGIMQYIAPSIQLLLGIFLYKESFGATQIIGFGVVWLALLLFWLESVYARRALPVQPLPELGE
ncbi:MAG: EamA family transporter RarD [Anaerolineae bacterium CG_4_9_14_3_um_filter_57_17]|nr:EamA family transporter RarD [bacterium]NCT20060.1 EamA family transporter RarD [bacterium]OIO83214.1 MAG: EamA family transporter [Anaerolineae bacterium CG2_30_57_67]PJB65181.1 MAG: EamA family transporter RarD [Anaerolineae bacterium CG_4_9_14_3_um_filter_57_17]